jgi:hypothetical protein
MFYYYILYYYYIIISGGEDGKVVRIVAICIDGGLERTQTSGIFVRLIRLIRLTIIRLIIIRQTQSRLYTPCAAHHMEQREGGDAVVSV